MIEAEQQIREALAAKQTAGLVQYLTACSSDNISALLAELDRLRDVVAANYGAGWSDKQQQEIDRLTRELAEARAERDAILQAITDPENQPSQYGTVTLAMYEKAAAERDALRDVLLYSGFVPCDEPACNCGSWHARFGYPERLREIADALAEAGHELSNENGNLVLNALRQLIDERDALAKQGEAFQRLVDACKLLASEAEEYDFDDGMGRGALLDYWYEFDRKLDAAIDAQIEKERSE